MQTEVIPICRICLGTLDEYIDMESSFYSDQTQEELKYMDCFRQCTHLDVEINGQVKQGICVHCSLDLRCAYEFLKRAEKATQFYEEYAQNFLNELHTISMERDVLACSPSTMDETEMIVEIEQVELDEALSETKEFLFPKTQSDEDTIDILKLNHLQSDGDDYQSETDNTLNVVAMIKKKITNNDQMKKYVSEQELEISAVSEEITYKNAKRTQVTNTCRVRSNKNSSESSGTCKICQSNVGDLNLTEHMKKYHMSIDKCQHCEYEDIEYRVRKHEKLYHNTDKYLCDICSKTYFSLGSLKSHLNFHKRKETNFQSEACKICGKTFSIQRYLQEHLKTHKNERTLYECDQCDKRYLSKSAWYYHIKMHKGLHKDKTLKCLECDKQFVRQCELKIHMRFHLGIYPYNCDVCGKTFAIKGHLRSHMWRHQGLKLQCEDCPKTFTSSRSLKEHSFTHTQMPFPCCYCPKAYTTTYKYKNHLKTAHSIELNEEELQKVRELRGPIDEKLLLRKKLKLVQANSVMKKANEKTGDIEDLYAELF